MLNTQIYIHNRFYHPNIENNIAFTGDFYKSAFKDDVAKITISKALKEYFAGLDDNIFNEFIRIIETNSGKNDDVFEKIRAYLNTKPQVMEAVKKNAQNVAKSRIEFLKAMFLDAKNRCSIHGSSLLDIGSGDGKVTQELISKNLFNINNSRALGVELQKLPEHEALPFKTLICSGEHLSGHTNNKYDIVTLISTLHHIENPKNQLKQIYNTLSKNGHLIVIEHPPSNNSDKLFHNFMDEFEYRVVAGNDNFPISGNLYSHDGLKKLMEECGFKMIQKVEPSPDIDNPFRRVCFVLQKIPAHKLDEAYKAKFASATLA